jgi:hypothetical protein
VTKAILLLKGKNFDLNHIHLQKIVNSVFKT